MDDISPFAVPDGRNAITAGWLEAVLKHNGTIGPDVQVGLPAISEMEGPGLIGHVIRLHLTYDPAAAGPASLIAKFPSRTLAQSLAFSCTEADFYAHHINGPAALQTPKVYYCRSDESNNRCCVVLEDLHNGRFVKQIDGCNETQARLAIRAIARLHGAWWNKPLPAALSRVRPPLSSPIGNFCSARLRSYKGAWPSLLSAIMPRFIKSCDLLRAQLSAGPRTLVHGDFHSQNIYFSDDGASLTLIDFQFVQQGSGMLDVARFLATSLPVHTRRDLEWGLLQEYHRCLVEQGITDYDFDRSIHDLKAGLLWNLSTPVALHLVNIMEHGKVWPGQLPIVERCMTAIEDWKATELL